MPFQKGYYKKKKVELNLEEVDAKLRSHLFDKQIAFIEDPSKAKIARCGRRAGKSVSCAVYLIRECIKQQTLCCYIGLTRLAAKRIMWRILVQLCEKYAIPITTNVQDLSIRFQHNQSDLFLVGADNSSEIDKLRGPFYSLVVMDESASYGSYMCSLIEEALEPALMDKDGTICLIGTPNPACSGYFFNCDHNERWSKHHWTVLDNPFIPHAQEYLAQKLIEKRWDEHNPIYQREWLGNWVKSLDAYVYKWSAQALIPKQESLYDYETILGVDLGYDDESAFVIIAFSRIKLKAVIIDAYKRSTMSISEVIDKIKEFHLRYNCIKTVADTGGLGKMIVEEMNRRHGMGIFAAEKQDKYSFIETMNDDLATGRLEVMDTPHTHELIDEWTTLEWADREKRVEKEGQPNHLSDAALYAWRESLHFMSRLPEAPLKRNSEAWWQYQEQHLMKVSKEKYGTVQDTNPWWERDNQVPTN